MPKKAPKSGFYYFMLEYKRSEENQGRKFPNGLRDVQADPKCSEAWNALSVEEKNEYNRLGKDKREKQFKLTGMGESVELLQREKRLQMEYEANMKDYIDRSIKEADKINNLDVMTFYFIHVNHFYTKVNLDNNTTDYIPAEYALAEFSLKDGIKRIHHQIINTPIETGYTREYIEHSDSTHKLTNELPEGESDYAVMYKNLEEFLNPGKTANRFPPLYTVRRMKTIVPCLLERMANAAKSDVIFDIYSLEYLFGTLMGTVNENFPEIAGRAILAEAQFDKDAYMWSSDIECYYHANIEGTGPYCSQSLVQQWGFTIADYCCPKMELDMIPGAHCPLDSLISDFQSMKMMKSSISTKDTGSFEANRKKHLGNFTIIDYSKESNPASIINYSSASAASVSTISSRIAPQKQMRAPKTMAKVFESSDEVPIMNDDNFPAIGGRGKPRSDKSDTTKPLVGRGRGGIRID
ncbi:hypothetical protein PV327_010461 [Microctonus hyperodae]|uniref:HMG box domain-containing protein n=1 Tax=Microctonus hyperodae TaxID=165561 RepID=A0AA39FSV9_MICHY|nr:hypothetical protein PV327_010461 [Microctonus hyperodae]